jgi:hypothetical protein
MLGGGVIAGELWWPGKTLISIPTVEEVVRYTATERYSHGWVDQRAFGLAQVKPEGESVIYDPYSDVLEGNDEALVFSEDSLEQIVIDIRRDQGPKALSIKPRTITVSETFGKTEAKRRARVLGSDQAHGERLSERIVRVFS